MTEGGGTPPGGHGEGARRRGEAYPAAAGFARLAADFEALRPLEAPARAARLAAVRAADPEHAAALERLLSFHVEDPDALATPAAAFEPGLVAEALAAEPPAAVGPYRLVRSIGRGGMGEVWLGERTGADFRQTVAVKLLRPHFGDERLLQRFRTERRILAGLRHPNIAALLDGGTTGDGRPFVVMEYVDGTDLVTWCEERQLSLRARLLLFAKVCAAVDHAHRNLVVHRDLKPGNVLVTGSGEPKLLDFGIAKLLAPDGAETGGGGDGEAGPTGAVTLLLTPEYASPEQVRGEPVTVATDVYALGALLYELLCGRRAQQPASRSLTELTAAICERQPPPPSTAVLQGGAAPACGLSRERLARALRGDLDTIAAQAMRKEPLRRYPSAAALAEDVGRHLDGLPVRARPDTAAYRAAKFLRRNRLPVAAAAVALALAVAFVVQIVRSNAEIAAERDLADAERTAAVAARRLAESQRSTAGEITEFLVGLFETAEPDAERAQQMRARELLDRGRARIDQELGAAPLQRALLQSAMGRAYLALGLVEDAAPLVEQSAAILLAVGADADPVARAGARHLLGQLHAMRDELEPAERLLREAIATWPADDPNVLRARARSRAVLSAMLRENGRYDAGRAVLEEAERELAPVRDREPRAYADVVTALAALARETGDYDESLRKLELARGILQAHYGPDHPVHAHNLRERGTVLKDRGDLGAARTALEKALAHDRSIGGGASLDVDTDLFLLAMLAIDEGDYARAEELLRDVLQRDRQRFGPEHGYVALDLGQIANVLGRRGRFADAEGLYLEAIAMQRKTLSADHPELATSLGNLGSLYGRMDRHEEAEVLFREAFEIRSRVFAPEHPTVLTSRQQLAVAAFARGDVAGAAAQFREILAARRRALGEHPMTAGSLLSLATALQRLGERGEAEQLLIESIEMFRRTLPPGHVDLARPLYGLGAQRLAQGDHGSAEELLRECHEIRAAALPPEHPDAVRARRSLARCHALQRDFAAAEPLLRGLVLDLRAAGWDAGRLESIVEDLARVYEGLGETAKAAAVRAGG